MKIIICGSMAFQNQMRRTANNDEKLVWDRKYWE